MKLVLIVGCIILSIPVSSYTVKHPVGSGVNHYWHVLRRSYSKCFPCPNSTQFSQSNVEIKLNTIDGAILRYLQIAQEFYDARPIGTPPEVIMVEQQNDLPGSNWFDPTYPTITFDHRPPSIQIACHEYGHYANWTLWGNTFNSAPRDFKEGWANFYSYAVQNYAKALYGEDGYWKWGSEEWPFGSPRYREGDPNVTEEDRVFYDIPHCFLWNVYDAYDDEGFKDPARDGLDNDDVGHPLLIFQTEFPSSPNNTMEGFKDALIDAVGGGEEGESIQAIYDFVFTREDYPPMRPAQIKELSGSIIDYNGEIPTIYLEWEHRAYGTCSYQNAPTVVYIYQDDGDDGWIYCASREFPYESITFAGNILYPLRYKVTAANYFGDSHDAPVVQVYAAKIAKGDKTTSTPSYSLLSNPNPFNHETKIVLKLGAPAYGVIQIFDLLGREVEAKQFYELKPGSVDYTFKTEASNQQYYCKAQIHFEDGTVREETLTIVGSAR